MPAVSTHLFLILTKLIITRSVLYLDISGEEVSTSVDEITSHRLAKG